MWCPIIHEWGQPNIKVTSMKVTRFYWPSMTSQIKLWSSTCKVCLRRKTLPCNNKYELHHRHVGIHLFDVIVLDHLMVKTQRAKKKALTIVD